MNENLTRREWLARIGATAVAWPVCRRGAAADAQLPLPEAPATLRDAMHRVGQCCLAWLDPKRHLLPSGGYEVSHDAGRWWDAMLRLQAATGFAIPPDLESRLWLGPHSERPLAPGPRRTGRSAPTRRRASPRHEQYERYCQCPREHPGGNRRGHPRYYATPSGKDAGRSDYPHGGFPTRAEARPSTPRPHRRD